MTQRNRQLAAIVFTDIVGYASLMRTDEARAADIRKRHRAIFDALTPRYGGKILQYYGDGTLSIFNSSVSAVECAVEMQRAFAQDPVVPLRIGIHSGDIAYDETEVFGDGLNVAARVEPCCIPGGIYLTGKVYDDIKNHDWLSALDLGAFTFKGIGEPLRLYAVDNAGIAVPSGEQIRQLRDSEAKLVAIAPAERRTLPERLRQTALLSIPLLLFALLLVNLFNRRQPAILKLALPGEEATSIAVLPFDDFSEHPDNTYFSDGITEDILIMLSRVDGLKVVSRTSAMQYKNSRKDVRQIGRELNANHILEGSVRRQGNKVRIAAQLIDTRNDKHVWAETYDRELTEIFDVQSQVAQDIAAALRKKLSEREWAEICKKPTDNLQAYDLYLKGREYYTRYTPRDNEQAIEMFRKALQLDPAFAQAYAGLGDALAQKAFKSGMDDSLLDSAIDMSSRAIALDDNLSEGHKALGLAYHYRGWYDRALEEYHKAVKRNPNNDMALNNIGAIYQDQGKLTDAIRWARRALSINPQHTWSIINLARMYYAIGLDEPAVRLVNEGQRNYPDFAPFRQLLAAIFMRQQKGELASEQALLLIAESSDEPLGYQIMGEVALFDGNLEDAKAFFREADYLMEKAGVEKKVNENELNLAYIELQTGNATIGRTRLRAMIRQLTGAAQAMPSAHYFVSLSMAHAILDERQASLDWLRKALERNWLDYQMLRLHPFYRSMRADPGFRETLLQMEARARAIREQSAGEDETGRMI